MRFSYCESMTNPEYLTPLAIAAEESGFDSFLIPDSLIYPQESSTAYPYTPDGSRLFLEDKPFIDPFVLAASLSSATSTLRFVTYVLKLPIRHPVLVAKQAASVAVMSNNRLSLGVGLSPWPEDYAICGVQWKERGRRMDEQIDILRGFLESDSYFEFHGQYYEIPSAKMCPTPTESIPILIGGNGPESLKRAARNGGWMLGGIADDLLPSRILELGRLRDEGGHRGPFEIHAGTKVQKTAAGVTQLEEMGVTDVVVTLGRMYRDATDPESLADKLDAIHRYSDEVIAA
jgi:probable F420-dependent oxidoreductase